MRIVEVARTLRRSDAPLLSLLTDRDWIADVVRFELMFPTCSQKGMNGPRRRLRRPFSLVAGTGFEPATSGL
jgi:hypothetical protein